MKSTTIAVIGFGEVGTAFAEDLLAKGASRIMAWDVLFPDSGSKPSISAEKLGVVKAGSAAEAVAQAHLVICAVTAEQAVEAARAAVKDGLSTAPVYLDVNSVSPMEKQRAAALVNDAGGKFVEASIMSPIFPKRIKAPILLGGPYAKAFSQVAADFGFTGAKFCSEKYGVAAATKMCRSVIIKGVESLLSESLLAARQYGVEDSVLASLNDLFPGPDWKKLAPYMISRSLLHGKRRAEEMREVTKTIAEAGVEPLMSQACAQRQEWASQQETAPDADDLNKMLDGILGTFPPRE